MISNIQKKQVQDTFAMVADSSETVAELFYKRLFELQPEYRRLFSTDMKEQGMKLMQMLAVVIRGLDSLENLIGPIQVLAKRHVGYGVKPEDYTVVGEALLWTLAQGLGKAFTPEVKEAWTVTYQTLAAIMIEASQTNSVAN